MSFIFLFLAFWIRHWCLLHVRTDMNEYNHTITIHPVYMTGRTSTNQWEKEELLQNQKIQVRRFSFITDHPSLYTLILNTHQGNTNIHTSYWCWLVIRFGMQYQHHITLNIKFNQNRRWIQNKKRFLGMASPIIIKITYHTTHSNIDRFQFVDYSKTKQREIIQ